MRNDYIFTKDWLHFKVAKWQIHTLSLWGIRKRVTDSVVVTINRVAQPGHYSQVGLLMCRVLQHIVGHV